MSAYFGEFITRATLIGDITHKLRYAITNTAYISGTNVIFEAATARETTLCTNLPVDRNLSTLAGNNIAGIPGGPSGTGGLSVTPNANEVINLIRSWMSAYARVQKIQIYDTSDRTTDPVVVVAALTTPNATVVSQVNSAVSTAHGAITAGQPITAASINSFINQCQAIWQTYCLDGGAKLTYSYSYCHSNHCSHSNHGSRGRR